MYMHYHTCVVTGKSLSSRASVVFSSTSSLSNFCCVNDSLVRFDPESETKFYFVFHPVTHECNTSKYLVIQPELITRVKLTVRP